MISVIDDEVGNVVATLEEKKMRDNTLIIFQSDNGGVKSSMFSGDTKVEGQLPADNGPYRDGKGTLYEGGTRVAANWPGKIKSGVVNQMTHTVDWYPTLARLANASIRKNKPLDGMNVWRTISAGNPTPREEVVYNVDPFGGAVRQGDWKLVWKASLPPKIELLNLTKDPSETKDLSRESPAIAAQLRTRIIELARQMAPPLLLMEAVRLTLHPARHRRSLGPVQPPRFIRRGRRAAMFTPAKQA